jgi:hypothetical protein
MRVDQLFFQEKLDHHSTEVLRHLLDIAKGKMKLEEIYNLKDALATAEQLSAFILYARPAFLGANLS